MKAIIDGKRYNTETAELVARWNNGYYQNDFHLVEETLYKTPKGAYFLYYIGGALSKYSIQVGSNGSGEGDGIKVLSREEAAGWLEEHNCPDKLEAEFPNMVVDA